METVVGKNCKMIRLESETLANAFQAGELKKVTLEAVHNCCDNRQFSKELDFVYPDPVCDWTVFYATDLVDPAICVTPDGATCVDKFYLMLEGVYISSNGSLINVLNQEYNISSTQESTIVADIDNNLKNLGYVRASSYVEILDRGNGDFSISITIAGLPNGIVPQSIKMGNTTPCYARPYFQCIGSEPGAVCVEYESVYPFPDKTNPGLNLAKAYFIDYFLLTNPNTALSERVTVNFAFNYDINNPQSIDFTPLTSIINSWLVLRGLSEITFSVSISNGALRVKFSGEHDVFTPIRLFLQNTTDGTATQMEFNCSEFSVPNPVCEWQSIVETIRGDYLVKNIVGLWLEPSPGAYIQNALTQAYDITNLSDRQNMITEIETYFDNLGYPDVTAVIDQEDGLDTDSLYRVRIAGYPNRVYFLKTLDTSGDYEDADFFCGDIDFIPAGYDPTEIELIPEGLLVKAPFFGGSDAIPDGVYAIKLVVDKEDLTKTTERSCVFVDCVTRCNMVAALQKDLESDIHHYYEAIQNAADCDDCECEKACVLYAELLRKINQILGRDDEPCSCAGC